MPDTDRPTPEPEPIDAEIVPDPDTPSGAATPTGDATPAAVQIPTPTPVVPTDYTDAGVPTLDYVRDKIEGRSATAMGWEELRTREVEEAEKAFAEREEKGKAKLEEMRRQLGL